MTSQLPSYASLLADLEHHLEQMDPAWAQVTRDILFHRGAKALMDAPGSVRTHQSRPGGLLEHLLETADIALALADLRPYRDVVDRSLLVSMALVHDVGKIDSYKESASGNGYEYTESDRNVHHIGAGLLLFSEARTVNASAWRAISRFDESDALAHAIVSHHGHVAWKSIRSPRTMEAAMVHYADYAGAGLGTIASGEPWRQAT